MIGARHGKPASCYPVRNVADSSARHFLMDADEQANVLRLMRSRDERLFGIYHSHPDSSAKPSAADLDEIAHPDALYLIVSLKTRGVLELRAYRIGSEGCCREIALILETST